MSDHFARVGGSVVAGHRLRRGLLRLWLLAVRLLRFAFHDADAQLGACGDWRAQGGLSRECGEGGVLHDSQRDSTGTEHWSRPSIADLRITRNEIASSGGERRGDG